MHRCTLRQTRQTRQARQARRRCRRCARGCHGCCMCERCWRGSPVERTKDGVAESKQPVQLQPVHQRRRQGQRRLWGGELEGRRAFCFHSRRWEMLEDEERSRAAQPMARCHQHSNHHPRGVASAFHGCGSVALLGCHHCCAAPFQLPPRLETAGSVAVASKVLLPRRLRRVPHPAGCFAPQMEQTAHLCGLRSLRMHCRSLRCRSLRCRSHHHRRRSHTRTPRFHSRGYHTRRLCLFHAAGLADCLLQHTKHHGLLLRRHNRRHSRRHGHRLHMRCAAGDAATRCACLGRLRAWRMRDRWKRLVFDTERRRRRLESAGRDGLALFASACAAAPAPAPAPASARLPPHSSVLWTACLASCAR